MSKKNKNSTCFLTGFMLNFLFGTSLLSAMNNGIMQELEDNDWDGQLALIICNEMDRRALLREDYYVLPGTPAGEQPIGISMLEMNKWDVDIARMHIAAQQASQRAAQQAAQIEQKRLEEERTRVKLEEQRQEEDQEYERIEIIEIESQDSDQGRDQQDWNDSSEDLVICEYDEGAIYELLDDSDENGDHECESAENHKRSPERQHQTQRSRGSKWKVQGKQFVCECGQTFFYKTGLDMHKASPECLQRRHHADARRVYVRDKKSMSDAFGEYEENKEQEGEKYIGQSIKRNKITQVGNKFYDAEGNWIGYETGNRFACSKCVHITYVNKRSLVRHFQSHLPKKQWQFLCSSCGERFNRKDNLDYHTTRGACAR